MKHLFGRPKRNVLRRIRPTMKSVLIREVDCLSQLRQRASSFRAHELLYNHFDREKMGDHVSAVVIVMLVRLDGPVGIFGTREQGIAPRLLWRKPIKFPTSPRMPSHRIEKMRFGPALATIGAHRDLRHVSLAGPCSAEYGVHPIGQEGFVNTWPGDFGLQLHFS